MTSDLAAMRRDYTTEGLIESEARADPFEQFHLWFEDARAADLVEPNAMTLATVDAIGRPSARTVLLKAIDERGFGFFTNYNSRKGQDLDQNPLASLLFWWPPLERQVRIDGRAERMTAAESDGYFAERPRGAQIGAWASEQSAVIAGRAELEGAEQAAEERFAGAPVPRPPHWGGYRVVPESIEFWQGRRNRLHDRLRYRREGCVWRIERLAP